MRDGGQCLKFIRLRDLQAQYLPKKLQQYSITPVPINIVNHLNQFEVRRLLQRLK